MHKHTLTLTVMPDFGGAFAWLKQHDDLSRYVGVNTTLIDGDFCHTNGVHIGDIPTWLVQAFVQWQSVFEGAHFELDDTSFDWVAFHAYGMFLSALLQQVVEQYGVCVRYDYPAEDDARSNADAVIMDKIARAKAKQHYLQYGIPQREWSFDTLRDTLLALGTPIKQTQAALDKAAGAWGLAPYELAIPDEEQGENNLVTQS